MLTFRLGIAAVALTCAWGVPPVSIRMEDGGFVASGWTSGNMVPAAGWPSVFAVYAGPGDAPPMLGSYTAGGGAIVFRPRFPLSAGVVYRAVFRPEGTDAIEARFEIPAEGRVPTTRVLNVYPTAGLVPANQLKFYAEFSAPMGRGEAWRRIHLLDENGREVELPFLELDQELWDPQFRRLTILFDPGRIKRGVLPREEVGPALVPGKTYVLAIDREWRDGAGLPLRESFQKAFRVGPEERAPLDAGTWTVTSPSAATRDALVVRFPKPLDYALLLRALQVSGTHGRVEGNITIDAEETEWRFTPEQPWAPGALRIVIDNSLEDMAGNRIGRSFDVDQFEPISRKIENGTTVLPFRVRGE